MSFSTQGKKQDSPIPLHSNVGHSHVSNLHSHLKFVLILHTYFLTSKVGCFKLKYTHVLDCVPPGTSSMHSKENYMNVQ